MKKNDFIMKIVSAAVSLCVFFSFAMPAFATTTAELSNSLYTATMVAASSVDDFGYASTSGDFNGDGEMDLAISYMDSTDGEDPGVFIFYSADEQLMSSTEAFTISSIAAATDGTIEQITSTAGSNFGTSLAAGDINGDGVDDLAVGAPGQDTPYSDAGRVRLFFGSSANGLVAGASNSESEDTAADAALRGQSSNALSGFAVHVDDLDQDGFDDVLLGAPVINSNRGKMYIVYGEASFSAGSLGDSTYVDASLAGTSSSSNLGTDIDTGDFDGDGNIDIIYGGQGSSTIGGPGILYGSSSRFSGSTLIPSFEFKTGSGQMYDSVAAGDYNNDGYDDLLFTAYEESSLKGRASIILSSATRLSGSSGAYNFYIDGVTAGDQLGTKNGVDMGDLNNDGYDDIVISAADYSGGSLKGALGVFYGQATTPSNMVLTDADVFIEGEATGDYFGKGVHVTDLNGDGASELVSGAIAKDYGSAYALYNMVDRDSDGSLNENLGIFTGTDCNDEDSTLDATTTHYADSDGDGYGDSDFITDGCGDPATGYVSNSTDCDDSNIAKWREGSFYRDIDGDGYGSNSSGLSTQCYGSTSPTGYSLVSGDACDNDLSTQTTSTYYRDADSDTYFGTVVSLCPSAVTSAHSAVNNDCNDSDPALYQLGNLYEDNDNDGVGAGSAVLSCYGDDPLSGFSLTNTDQCDEDTGVFVKTTYYRDADSDTYGNASVSAQFCPSEDRSGYVANNTDSNDADPSVHTSSDSGGGNDDTGTGTGTSGGDSTTDDSTNDNNQESEMIETVTFNEDGSLILITDGVQSTIASPFEDGEKGEVILSSDKSVAFMVNKAGTRVAVVSATGEKIAVKKIHKKRQTKKKFAIRTLKNNKAAVLLLTRKKSTKKVAAVVYDHTKQSFVKTTKRKIAAQKKSLKWKIAKKKKAYRITVKDSPSHVFTLSKKSGALKKK